MLKGINSFDNILVKLKETVDYLGLGGEYYKKLSKPDIVLERPIEITLDNGKRRIFKGYRVQFNNTRGPYKGGIRFHPEADLDEVKTLSFLMNVKCAVANIPLGGGKGGIRVNPKELSGKELEKLSRAWVQAFYKDIGPDKDIPAPDVYTNPQIISWMVDEYSKIANRPTPAAFTGKPIDKGGSEGREFSTAQGGYYALRELAKKLKMKPEETRVVVQGFGNVGYNIARVLNEHGLKVIGLSDSRGGIFDIREKGMDPVNVLLTKKEQGKIGRCYCVGSVCDCENYKRVSNEDLLRLETDILIPAALENQITKDNVNKIKAKAIIELANGPITPEADQILFKKGVHVVPDILANTGGVIVSYFEWLQNLQNEHWSEKDVLEKLETVIKKEFNNIWAISISKRVDLRTAAYILGIGRIVEAMKKSNG